MRTIGQILREVREQRGYSLDDVEKNTKIRKELLSALENDDYDKLPPATFVKGFIKNYGKFLGLDIQRLMAIFRRGFETQKHPDLILESFTNPVKGRLRITPARAISLVIILIVLVFFTYLWVEYRQFVGAPNLVLTSPSNQISVDMPDVIVEGNTDPEVKVFVNNQQVAVDQNGHFKEEIKLSSSTNQITVKAVGRFGQTASVDRTVFVRK